MGSHYLPYWQRTRLDRTCWLRRGLRIYIRSAHFEYKGMNSESNLPAKRHLLAFILHPTQPRRILAIVAPANLLIPSTVDTYLPNSSTSCATRRPSVHKIAFVASADPSTSGSSSVGSGGLASQSGNSSDPCEVIVKNGRPSPFPVQRALLPAEGTPQEDYINSKRSVFELETMKLSQVAKLLMCRVVNKPADLSQYL